MALANCDAAGMMNFYKLYFCTMETSWSFYPIGVSEVFPSTLLELPQILLTKITFLWFSITDSGSSYSLLPAKLHCRWVPESITAADLQDFQAFRVTRWCHPPGLWWRRPRCICLVVCSLGRWPRRYWDGHCSLAWLFTVHLISDQRRCDTLLPSTDRTQPNLLH